MTEWYEGAGVVESVAGFVDTLTAESEGEGVDVIDAAIGGAGMVVDLVSSAANPLAAVFSAGVGWLLEHVSFIREPLDALLGNPDEINANTHQLKSAALEMKMIAEEHRQDVAAMGGSWSGESNEAFRQNQDTIAAQYEALGKTMDGTAATYALSGALVVELRAMVFDWISDLIGELIAGALIALASAAVTFGGSIAAYCGYAGTRAAMLATKMASRLSRLMAAMKRFGVRLAKLQEKMSGLMKGLEKFADYGDYAKTAYDAVKPYEMPQAQPQTPGVNPGTAS
ncbi:WXG100 family type VII secretion target [Kibdelosporangium phytohabitans]|uniref:ESX-1 secretion-associated protein EspA/EspE-like domain-containing protein n=1 Tax=Kibdelosporangium phytohabitans TaxID=860235 RepID=A0A0N7F3Q3_9PSEU|nr:WXG100 family type VII secretion target [Kibdelosporangium phytohabitans]ALG09271.1 hypothetical protein AOZ06_22275 [Kibdelosporangium phytohabitans]MBE1469481.1 uncharacterized protein YukE [Kibdelosporangium phytohabitans]